MIVPEPENEFSQRALAIKTLAGDSLGHVPKEHCGSIELKDRKQFAIVYDTGKLKAKPKVHWVSVSFTI